MTRRYRLLALPLLVACSLAAAADRNSVFERQGEDGTLELTNVPDGDAGYATVIVAPASAAAAAPPAAVPPTPEAAAGPAAVVPAPISESPMADRLRELYNGARAAHAATGR